MYMSENFQVYKLDLQKVEKSQLKLSTHWIIKKKQENSRKLSNFCFTNYAKAFVWITTNWKIFQEMMVPDHLICLLRNLYADQETTVRPGYEKMDWFQIGKGLHQGWILSPYLFNLYAEYIMWNSRLNEVQVVIKIARKNINNLR